MSKEEKFDVADFLVLNLSKEIENGMTIVQGTSTFIPLIATKLAMQNKKINFIGGFNFCEEIYPKFPSTFCQENYGKIKSFLGLSGFLDMLIDEKIDLEFLRPAQVDKFGNMNNTIIGDYKKPEVRFPGGMGIDDVMHFLKKTILYVPNHSKKVFVDKVDFVTASGWDKGKGPHKIITNMCIFEFSNKEIFLSSINPIYSVEDVKNETGFEFKISDNLRKMELVNEKTKNEIEKIDLANLRNTEIKEKRKEVLKNFEN